DHVDVLLTRRPTNDVNQPVTDVILQGLLVLGVDQLADENHEKAVVARTATVEVDPAQAQKLALAQEVGTLSLALRGVNSAEKITANSVHISDLVEVKRPRVVVPAGETVVVRHGTDKVTVQNLRGE